MSYTEIILSVCAAGEECKKILAESGGVAPRSRRVAQPADFGIAQPVRLKNYIRVGVLAGAVVVSSVLGVVARLLVGAPLVLAGAVVFGSMPVVVYRFFVGAKTLK